jgi:3-oxoacyl-[acyl-carrier protein] reductase
MGTVGTSRVVLVTGGQRGIGRAIAERFAANGDRVAITYRSGEVPEIFFGVRCDVTSTEQVDAAFAEIESHFGSPVEVVVANAGVTKDQLILRMSDDDFASVVDTNLGGAFRVARRAAKGMLRLKRGRIILIGSVVAMLGSPGQVNYAATKAGLIGLARSLARELGSRGITTNVIAPGFVETDMTVDLTDQRKQEIASNIPLGRYAQANEVAAAALFIASEDAGYITGAVIPVDGGLGMGH